MVVVYSLTLSPSCNRIFGNMAERKGLCCKPLYNLALLVAVFVSASQCARIPRRRKHALVSWKCSAVALDQETPAWGMSLNESTLIHQNSSVGSSPLLPYGSVPDVHIVPTLCFSPTSFPCNTCHVSEGDGSRALKSHSTCHAPICLMGGSLVCRKTMIWRVIQ